MSIITKLPGLSLIFYRQNGYESDLSRSPSRAKAKFLGHTIYGAAAGLGAAFLALLSVSQGDINPINAYRSERQQAQVRQLESKRIDELSERLFGENGLADTNIDNAYSFEELVSAYRRMGPRFQGEIFFPNDFEYAWTKYPVPNGKKPTAQELERVVQSFETEKRAKN